jgi:hypothetical protein
MRSNHGHYQVGADSSVDSVAACLQNGRTRLCGERVIGGYHPLGSHNDRAMRAKLDRHNYSPVS